MNSCASTGSLSGGVKDKIPPTLDSLKSDKSRQINLTPKELTFYFDEYIEVKDATKQVLISPPITYLPAIKSKGKRVTFSFDKKEVLKENTTYTINFGEAIVDFHEGNKLENFTFVFSTGPVIDSLFLKGKVTDALTDKLSDGILVFLYDVLEDSIVAKKKPLYSTRVSKDGMFLFENIKADTFKVLAIKDQNINYLYDLPSESVGFLNRDVITNDLDTTSIELVMSKTLAALDISTINARSYGKINVTFNQEAKLVPYSTDRPGLKLFPELVKDSMNIYYASQDSFQLFIPDMDTITVKPRKPKDFLKKNPFRKLTTSSTQQILVTDSIHIALSHPIDTIDRSKITLSDDIGEIKNFQITLDTSHKRLSIAYDWTYGISYTLVIDSGALRSIYGVVNDSTGHLTTILTPQQTGSMIAQIQDLDSTKSYVVNILRNTDIIKSVEIQNQPSSEIKLMGLIPDRYDFVLIQDDDQNRVWSPGSYWLKKQPEKIKTIKGDRARENWESTFILSWKTGTIKSADEPIKEAKGLDVNKKGKKK